MSKEDDLLLKEIANSSMERGLATLADFYEGLGNIPAELLDRQYKQELGWAEYILDKVKEHYRLKIKKAKALGRIDGIRLAINNLKKHYCIIPEARIKEIEEESSE